jgi:hypothetical protein
MEVMKPVTYYGYDGLINRDCRHILSRLRQVN